MHNEHCIGLICGALWHVFYDYTVCLICGSCSSTYFQSKHAQNIPRNMYTVRCVFVQLAQEGWFNINMPSYEYRKPIVEIRLFYDRLISTMVFPILVRRRHYIVSGPVQFYPSIYPSLLLQRLIDCPCIHYNDIIMSTMASQITSPTIVYSTVYSDPDQRKHQSSASLAFVRGIHRGPVNSPHTWPVTRKRFPFDDVTMLLKQTWGILSKIPVSSTNW